MYPSSCIYTSGGTGNDVINGDNAIYVLNIAPTTLSPLVAVNLTTAAIARNTAVTNQVRFYIDLIVSTLFHLYREFVFYVQTGYKSTQFCTSSASWI